MDINPLFDLFVAVPDPRSARNRLHLLPEVLVMATLAVLANADGWDDIEDYARSKQQWLSQFLSLTYGIPSADTFARVFARIDPEAFGSCFQQWIRELVGQLPVGVKVIQLDGKTVRGSYDRGREQSALQIVSAWAGEHRLLLGQQEVAAGSNEQATIPMVLELLDLKGAVVSIDAAGTQVQVAETIVAKEGDYLLALKKNQPQLYEAVTQWFEAAEESGSLEAGEYRVCGGHYRIETREVWSVPITVLEEGASFQKKWRGLQSIVMVRSTRQLWNKRTEGVRFYISSMEPDAVRQGELIRGHWGIENQLHWVLDVTFREDRSRIRKGGAGGNMAQLRRFCLTLLKEADVGKESLQRKRRRAGWDDQFMETILSALRPRREEVEREAS